MSREPFIVSEDKSLEVTFREVRDFEEYKDLTFETDPSTSDVEDPQETNDFDNSESTEDATESQPDDTWEDQFFVDEPYFGSSFEVKDEEPEDSEEDSETDEDVQQVDETDSDDEESTTAEEWVASDLSSDDADETTATETVVDEEVAADPVAAEKEFADEDPEVEDEAEADEPDSEESSEETVSEQEESHVAPEPFGSFIVEAGEESHPVTVEAEPAWEDDTWGDDSDSNESDDEKESVSSFSELFSGTDVTALILGQVKDVETLSLDEDEESPEVDTFEAITTEHESLNKADTVEELEPEYSDLGQPETIALEEGEVPHFEELPQASTTSDDSSEELEELELDFSNED
jgi:hypothetical protein